ncbi:MAG: hypothetical protein R2843_04585 [Thermomicrobiales bacterium]
MVRVRSHRLERPRERRIGQALVGWELARELGLPVARSVSPVVAELPEAIDVETVSLLAFSPTRIQIPAIDVDASIEQIGIVNGSMQTPDGAWNVGWYQETALAGGNGGHVFGGSPRLVGNRTGRLLPIDDESMWR